jgi:dipeptidyl aminopeptidase/acylaminoacyl peptidase
MFRALKAQGVPTELHIAPGEAHIWLRPAHQLHKMNAETEWFERHVRKIAYVLESIPADNNLKVLPAP